MLQVAIGFSLECLTACFDWRGSPVSKQSFNRGLHSFDLADASKTIRSLVDSADSPTTSLWDVKFSF